MKSYIGTRRADRICDVRVHNVDGRWQRLRIRLDLFNHSPTGFEWGYAGSGPAQLALAMLADALKDDEKAVQLHQKFKFKVIAMLDRDAPWEITQEQVLQFVKEFNDHVAPASNGTGKSSDATDSLSSRSLLDPA
jgi:hypothetical protein